MGFERLGAVLRSQAWTEAGEHNLTPTQRTITALLAAAPAPLRLSELADRLMVSAPTVSDAVNSLVGKGLVDKTRATGDARALALVLTDAGKKLARKTTTGAGALEAAIAALPPAEQSALLGALVNLIGSLQESGVIAAANTCASCSFFRPHAHPGEERPHHCAFVDAPLGKFDLRVHCPDHDVVPVEDLRLTLRKLRAG